MNIHDSQADSNREPLVSGRKSLTTQLGALNKLGESFSFIQYTVICFLKPKIQSCSKSTYYLEICC